MVVDVKTCVLTCKAISNGSIYSAPRNISAKEYPALLARGHRHELLPPIEFDKRARDKHKLLPCFFHFVQMAARPSRSRRLRLNFYSPRRRGDAAARVTNPRAASNRAFVIAWLADPNEREICERDDGRVTIEL